MKIGEAVDIALKTGTLIYRESAKTEYPGVMGCIKPTNSYNACLIVVLIQGKPQESCRCWNPTADDLMADDWALLKE